MNITPITNHRTREKGMIIYPVYSRRSAGLSIGINLFPDKKNCQFDCPYCEVFPFYNNAEFSLGQMEEDLRHAIASAIEQNITIKDICFSGNGEPTLSPNFAEAFKMAEKIRRETYASAKLVLITNGAGFLQPHTFSLLKDACSADKLLFNPSLEPQPSAQAVGLQHEGSPLEPQPSLTTHEWSGEGSPLDIWVKIDAGTPEWYQKMNRCLIPFNNLTEMIKVFVSATRCTGGTQATVTIQTMLCAINGEQPSEEEKIAWEAMICELAEKGSIRKVQLYGKARAAPEDPLASMLPDDYLEKRASSLRYAFDKRNLAIPVEIFI